MAHSVKLIKTFDFPEENRAGLTLDANTRLNIATHNLQLKESGGFYPLSGEVHTWIANPHAVKRWTLFQVHDIHTKLDDVTVTYVRYRLKDSVNQYWWNGSAWVVSTTSWNTEAEICANISTFPVTNRTLGVAIHLATIDDRFTPQVVWIKVLYEAVIDFQLDLVARTLIGALKLNCRPVTDVMAKVPGSTPTATVQVAFPLTKTPYNFISIDSVFNHSDDSHHLNDLFVSYVKTDTTLTLTLNAPVPAGKVLLVKFKYEPEVTLTTGRVYTEQNKVPAILISDINFIKSRFSASSADEVVNKATGAGWRVHAPTMNDIEFTLQFATDKESDQYRLADEAKRFFKNNPIIKSKGMDEPYRLWLWDEYIGEGVIGQEDIHGGKLRARIVQAAFFEKAAEPVHLVKRVIVSGGNMNTTIVNKENS